MREAALLLTASLCVASNPTARYSFTECGDNFSEEIALTGSRLIGRQLYFAFILVADSPLISAGNYRAGNYRVGIAPLIGTGDAFDFRL